LIVSALAGKDKKTKREREGEKEREADSTIAAMKLIN